MRGIHHNSRNIHHTFQYDNDQECHGDTMNEDEAYKLSHLHTMADVYLLSRVFHFTTMPFLPVDGKDQ